MHLDRTYRALGALPEDLRRRVQAALGNEDLLPSSEVFARTLTRIARQGAEHKKELLPPLIRGQWRRDLASSELGYSSSTLARVLGFGDAMTRFSVAGIPMSTIHRRAVTSLGVLSNFIVSLYDQLADVLGERDLLARPALVGLLQTTCRPERQETRASAYGSLIRNAVETYSGMLHRLPYSQERPSVRRSIISTILKLYDAETATLGKLGRRSVALQEGIAAAKGALSHEVMGLPAWLTTRRVDRNAMSRHRRWLRALGELHGWIDDVVDIEEDEHHVFPNRVMVRLRAAGARQTEATLRSILQEITRLGCSVRDRWSVAVANETSHRRNLEEFKTCLCYWLGGPRLHSI